MTEEEAGAGTERAGEITSASSPTSGSKSEAGSFYKLFFFFFTFWIQNKVFTFEYILPFSWVWGVCGIKTSRTPRPGPPMRVNLLTLKISETLYWFQQQRNWSPTGNWGEADSPNFSSIQIYQSCCSCSRITGSTPSSTKLCFTPSLRRRKSVCIALNFINKNPSLS